jgi:aspartate-semialdehyde dehydrogenase
MRIPVALLGATGSVGQRLTLLLSRHPWFDLRVLAASERSIGKKYRDAVHWVIPGGVPEKIGEQRILACDPVEETLLVFSALDSSVAGSIEENWARKGHFVISNAKNHRMDPYTPLIIPEVNTEHLESLTYQDYGNGGLVTNPNCVVSGIALALKPLIDAFGLESLHAVTMQALSGAGLPGVPAVEALGNVIPHIYGEEAKIQEELKKIWGEWDGQRFNFHTATISAQCNRVPVNEGHLASLTFRLSDDPSEKEIMTVLSRFHQPDYLKRLPSAPEKSLCCFDTPGYPQPRLHKDLGEGMSVSLGGLKKMGERSFQCVVLSHNTIRGAAGAALLNAELCLERGWVKL